MGGTTVRKTLESMGPSGRQKRAVPSKDARVIWHN